MRGRTGRCLRRLGAGAFALSLSATLLAAEDPDPEPASSAEAPAPAEEQGKAAAEEPPAETNVLAADSGVSMQTMCTNCNNADLSVGGLGNDHVVVSCDGMPVPSGLAQIYLLSVMPPTMIDRVAVSRGAGRADYEGGAVGGGIEIERREPKESLTINAAADSGDFGWRGNRVELTGKSGLVGGWFAGTTAESDSIDPDGDGFANLPEFDRTTLEGGLVLEPGRDHKLRLGGALYEEDQLDGPAGAFFGLGFTGFAGYNRENVDFERTQYDLSWEWSLPGASTLTVSGSTADHSEDIEETEDPDPNFGFCGNLLTGGIGRFCPTYFIDDTHDHAEVSWSRPIGTQATIRAGASLADSDYDVIDVRYNAFQKFLGGSPDFPVDFVLEEDVQEDGYWVEGQTAIGSRLDLVAGVRYVNFDYEDNEDEVVAFQDDRAVWLGIPLPEGDRYLPRAALTWKPFDTTSLRFTAGTGFRAPTPAFSEVCCGRRYRGNRGIEIEKSESYGIEATYQPAPGIKVGGSAFLTTFDDLIVNMVTMSFFGQHTYQNANVKDARQSSLGVDARFDGPRWLTTRFSYTWLDFENRTDGDAINPLIDFNNVPRDDKVFHYDDIPYTTDAHAAASLDFRLPLDFGLLVGAAYSGHTHIQTFDAEGPGDTVIVGSDVGEELFETDDFWLVSVNLRKAFASGLDLVAGVDNVFDEVQDDLGDPHFDYNWGSLRGRYVYGGLTYRYSK